MALFPFFANIEGKEVLIIGGGKHALEKVMRLSPYKPEIKVIASHIQKEFSSFERVVLVPRKFREEDLNSSPLFVIVAGENQEENRNIALLCRSRGIPVNTVDDKEYCDFLFPALIDHGHLTIGVCTNGASPATAVILKKRIEEQIPDKIEEILDFLLEKRPEIMKNINNKKKRFQFYHELSRLCMEKNMVPKEEEFQKLLAKKNISE